MKNLKFLVHIAPSVLHPKEWFIFYQTKEGAEKEERDIRLHRCNDIGKKKNAKS